MCGRLQAVQIWLTMFFLLLKPENMVLGRFFEKIEFLSSIRLALWWWWEITHFLSNNILEKLIKQLVKFIYLTNNQEAKGAAMDSFRWSSLRSSLWKLEQQQLSEDYYIYAKISNVIVCLNETIVLLFDHRKARKWNNWFKWI